MIPFISSLKMVIPDPFLMKKIVASVADAAVNPTGIKTLLANGLSTFPIKNNPVQFLVMALKVYLEILLIILYYAIEFLIILY